MNTEEAEAFREWLRGLVESARLTPGALSKMEGVGGGPRFSFDFFTRDPGLLELAASAYIDLIANLNLKLLQPLNLLAFIDGDIMKLAGSICTDGKIWLPHIVVGIGGDPLRGRIYLPQRLWDQQKEVLKGCRVVVITDHVSSGQDLYAAVTALQVFGAKVIGAITFSMEPGPFAAMGTGFAARLEGIGVQLQAIALLERIPGSADPSLTFNEELKIPVETAGASATTRPALEEQKLDHPRE